MHEAAACLSCGAGLRRSFVDLGTSPLSNAFLSPERLAGPELHHPLKTFVCEKCLLVQLPRHERRENIFDENYAYFSSFSETWLEHAKAYAAKMIPAAALGAGSLVVEIASNDGYLLRWFRDGGIPVLGIEPTKNTADAAMALGIPTRVAFFGKALAEDLADEGHRADLMAANNVLAHVPDIHDFIEGFRILLKPSGIATFEFPHLLRLMEQNQFDTIYHEHFSYLSLHVVERILAAHGLAVHDVEELGTHGGSLRVFASHEGASRPVDTRVDAVRSAERAAGLDRLSGYDGFSTRVERVKDDLLSFLLQAKRDGKSVAGYGAPAKGNTLLNYCGVRSDLLAYTVDRSPHKQGRFLPGVRIPIYEPGRITETRPDYLLILPWNLKDEIMGQMAAIRSWSGKFVLPIPHLEIL